MNIGKHSFYYKAARLLFLAVLGFLLSVSFTHAQEPTTTSQAWLEPRGLNVVDLVGLVPEDHLQGSVLSYEIGILQYISGERNGNEVKIRTRIYPYYSNDGNVTIFNCLGQVGTFDQWPSPVPASTMRIFAGVEEVTSSVFEIEYWPAGQALPNRAPMTTPHWRYDKMKVTPSFSGDGALQLPANAGCYLFLSGSPDNLTAEFTVQTSSPIAVETLDTQDFTFRTYIGPGAAGQLESLRAQMQARYPGIRHDKFTLTIPDGADYALVNFPPTSVNPGGDSLRNLLQPVGGTYRFSRPVNNVLSVDHRNTMALPIFGQWQDADQAPGTTFLPFFNDAAILASPEYFVPSGFPYDSCMSNGGCAADLLTSIYEASMTMSIHYYRITRTEAGLTRIPLRQVGPAWSPGQVAQARSGNRPLRSEPRQGGSEIYLPLITFVQPPSPPEPDDPTGCPCGWFDSLGRMLDYIPPQ